MRSCHGMYMVLIYEMFLFLQFKFLLVSCWLNGMSVGSFFPPPIQIFSWMIAFWIYWWKPCRLVADNRRDSSDSTLLEYAFYLRSWKRWYSTLVVYKERGLWKFYFISEIWLVIMQPICILYFCKCNVHKCLPLELLIYFLCLGVSLMVHALLQFWTY